MPIRRDHPRIPPHQPSSLTHPGAAAADDFGVSLITAIIGILYLPIDMWQRGFLGITLLFLTSSTFTLAKVVRDRQEQGTVRARFDEARIDKLMAEHDPFKSIT